MAAAERPPAPEATDFLFSVFSAALEHYRCDTVLRPYPREYRTAGDADVDYARLVRWAEETRHVDGDEVVGKGRTRVHRNRLREGGERGRDRERERERELERERGEGGRKRS